ncbi:2Fe-2S iron-sulfur cluster-binding protein [Desulfosediminicola flagellatus]|uniref:2Fe-2S iron-sulfur cluster-binding protein n=1 Tax=Desulfosediminicola flagellatus TaxID=2569541 RepID=UPI0010AD9601|nr:2Fe-2S iron-sulfur cluster-binding protein [Desulfosediminicola flagellatus]
MANVTIKNLGVTIAAQPGQSLLNSLLYEDVPIHTVCGGRARCGCCRVRLIDGQKGVSPVNKYETVRLSEHVIEQGWRLACQVHILRDITIYLPTADELDRDCSKKNS